MVSSRRVGGGAQLRRHVEPVVQRSGLPELPRNPQGKVGQGRSHPALLHAHVHRALGWIGRSRQEQRLQQSALRTRSV
ncbi:hypothetical protein U9M48_038438 [Paspalum notatum var. saurae]|uniref:Uncharacterized protein n=1 Tax=Paspalum notatum var. saurae TaxID=547442 RepID=A0AAQ3XBM2_PASNO